MTGGKALTLWQPWASLVAVGLKTIETRPWHTNYRGELWIHAAKRRMGKEELELWWPHRRALEAQMDTANWETLPLGAVVARCRLVDCVPMVSAKESSPANVLELRIGGALHLGRWGERVNVSNQRSFGHFAPERFAWILEDIEALPKPIPALGGQRIWNWRPE